MPPLAVGTRCDVVIRPDEMRFLSPTEEAEGEGGAFVSGTIRAVHAHSAHASVEVDLPPVLTVHLLNPDVGRLGLQVGTQARLLIPTSAVHLCHRADATGQRLLG